jgi:hypothetical protein
MLTDDELMMRPWEELSAEEQGRVRIINLGRAHTRGRDEGIAIVLGWVLILGIALALLTTAEPYGVFYAAGWLAFALASKRLVRR